MSRDPMMDDTKRGRCRHAVKTKLTSLPQLVVTVIAHFGHAVFHVFQRIPVPGAAPTNNLRQITYDFSTNNTVSVQETRRPWGPVVVFSALLTRPQLWQWCLRRVRLKSEVQFMHIIACDTGTSVGAFSPRHKRRGSLAWESKHSCFS